LFARSGATVGKVFQFKNYKGLACYAGYLIKATPSKLILSDFLYNFTQSSCYLQWRDGIFTQSTIQNISAEKYSSLLVILPPLKEQQKIAFFLDDKSQKIEQFIKNKQRLIELLEEEKKTLITQAVTKGINPDVNYKNSGVEWIGDIPEHWKVRKISRSFNFIGSGTTPASSNRKYYDNGNIPWINTGDLNNDILVEVNKCINETALKDFSSLKIYPIDTLIIAMYGATIGKLGILSFKATTNQACCCLYGEKYFNTKFVFYWFFVNKNNIVTLSYGGGQPNISQDLIKSLKVQSPPLQEQQKIASFLDDKSQKVDELKAKYNQEIDLINEYKERLIYDAVTGKIKVTGEI
jgi:type I restriction enzyme S subunit